MMYPVSEVDDQLAQAAHRKTNLYCLRQLPRTATSWNTEEREKKIYKEPEKLN